MAGITDAMDMSLSRLRVFLMNREAWRNVFARLAKGSQHPAHCLWNYRLLNRSGCRVRRAAGALARCARLFPPPGLCARARSLALPSFFSPLPPSLSPVSPPRALGCPRLLLALPLSPVGSVERCELWETATPPPARDLPPGPAPCPALPSARGSAKAPRTHQRRRIRDANALAAPPNSLPPLRVYRKAKF